MRLFVALDIDDAIRGNLTRFLDKVRAFAPDARWSRPESLHVTLKFIGERPETEFEEIKRSLETIQFSVLAVQFRGCGFFPHTQAPRVFWAAIEAEIELRALAARVDDSLAQLGVPKEKHTYNPHLTLARAPGHSAHKSKEDSSKRVFHRLHEELSALPAPEFGRMTAREFFLYQSQPSPGGSKYTKLAAFALR